MDIFIARIVQLDTCFTENRSLFVCSRWTRLWDWWTQCGTCCHVSPGMKISARRLSIGFWLDLQVQSASLWYVREWNTRIFSITFWILNFVVLANRHFDVSVNYFFSSFTSRLRDKVAIQEQFKKDYFRYFTSTLAFGQGARLVCHAHLGTFLLFSFPTLGTLPSMPQACYVRIFLRICAWKRCGTRQELIFCII